MTAPKATTSPKARASYHHGDLHNALLDAADWVLKEKGLQGFTLRACARQAEVSHAAPSHHFGDVQGLLRAVAERGFARLAERLQQAVDPLVNDLHDASFAVCRAYVSFAEENPEHFRVMFRNDLTGWSESPPEAAFRTFALLTDYVRRLRGEPERGLEGLVTDKDPDLVSDIVLAWCNVHGYAHLRLEQQLVMVSEEQHLEMLRCASQRIADLIRSSAKA